MSTASDIRNRQVYLEPGITRHYQRDTLTRVEAVALLKYLAAFAGRDVLDLGVGTGRSSIYLAPLARRYEAIDYSPEMVAAVHAAMPAVSAHLGDMRDLTRFEDASFDFVFGPNNVIDAVGNRGRQLVLGEVARVLRHDGIFLFSSHNLDCVDANTAPQLEWVRNPITLLHHLLQWSRQMVNHARMKPLCELHAGHALLDDHGHDYTLLHFYVEQVYQRDQLRDAGFDTIEVLDRAGYSLAADAVATESADLMYVARKR